MSILQVDRSIDELNDGAGIKLERERKEEEEGIFEEYNEEEIEEITSVNVRGQSIPFKEFLREKGEKWRSLGTISHKRTSITVENATCSVKKPQITDIETIQKFFLNCISGRWITNRRRKTKEKILKDVTFALHPGQMTMLIGGPGSGKSTLLDMLAGRTAGKIVTGDIKFNGRSINNKTYPNEVSYVIQDDMHLPLLTVKETLKFAAMLQLPPWFSEEDVDERVDIVMQLLRLTHCKDTIIGNDLVKGISGGEKRRVSVGIEWVKKPSIFLLDEPTTGLDAAAAFRIGRDLRVIASFGPSVLCALLQPSYELFCQFDNLIILCKGQIAYWGPRTLASEYFKGLGYNCPVTFNEAEFLATVVDEPEKFWDEGGPPESLKIRSSKDFIEAWKTSALKIQMEKQMKESSDDHNLSFCSPGKTHPSHKDRKTSDASKPLIIDETFKNSETKGEGDSNKSKGVDLPEVEIIDPVNPLQSCHGEYDYKYARSGKTQMKMLLWRGFLLVWRERNRFVVREVNDIVIALLLGTIFLSLDNSQMGAYSKEGLIFFTLFILGFSSLAGIPGLFPRKPVFYYQSKARYYRAEYYFLTQLILQLPFAIVEAALFGTIIYWLSGLNPDASRWAFFLFVLFWVYLIGVVLSFLWAYISPTEVLGSVSGTAFLAMLVLFSGYLIPKRYMHHNWMWFYYVSYFQYAFNALITNEFEGEVLYCNGNELAPPDHYDGSQGDFGGVSVCPITSGADYISRLGGYGDLNSRWWNLAAIIGIYLFAVVFSYLTVKFVVRSYPIRSGEKNVETKLKKLEAKKKIVRDRKYKSALAFKDLVYTINLGKKAENTLLHGVNGYVKPGMVLALMGPSGAGKSTLLDVLANKKNKDWIAGERKLNGELVNDRLFHRFVGYVEQNDLLYPFHTVLEALTFSARSRLARKVTEEQREAIVQRALDLLGLKEIAGHLIGYPDSSAGIRRDQRKRLSIGIELCAEPHILFLDEPTSGLDSVGADQVMAAVANIAKAGTACICTIHQPSKRIFLRCTDLLLMKKGGHQVYFGPVGKNAEMVLRYFGEKFNLRPPVNQNPADFILNNTNETEGKDTAQVWNDSEEKQLLKKKLNDGIEFNEEDRETFKRVYPLPWRIQVWLNFKRFSLSYQRNPSQNVFIIFRSIFLGVVIGTAFGNMQLDQAGAYLRPSLLFFVANIADFTAFASIIPIFLTRPLFYRERASGMYRASAFGIAKFMSDLPGVLLELTLFYILVYLISHLQYDWGRAFFAYLVFIGLYLVPSSIGQFYAIISKDVENASLVFCTTLTFFTLVSGVLLPRTDIPTWWIWGYWISYVQYVDHALVLNEVTDLKFSCPNNVGAVPMDVNGTTKYYCPITHGQDIIEEYDMIPGLKWGAVGAIFGLYLFFVGLSLAGLRFVNHQKR